VGRAAHLSCGRHTGNGSADHGRTHDWDNGCAHDWNNCGANDCNHSRGYNASRYNACADHGRAYNSDNTCANDCRPDYTDDSGTHHGRADYGFNVGFISKYKI
jgi:hypothetical protein